MFHRGAVEALAPTEGDVSGVLTSLVRTELIRPDHPQIPGQDAFRFRHILIRDAAYNALPKTERADLHERFAGWLERHGASLPELDEILGYHLERACRYRAELGVREEDGRLPAAARRRLTRAGERALLRSDYSAAFDLLGRAASLAAGGGVDLALELDRVEAAFRGGRIADAHELAVVLAERGAATNDRVAELCGHIRAARMQVSVQPEGATERLARLVEESLPELEATGSDLGLCTAYDALTVVLNQRNHHDAQARATINAIDYARRAGIPHVAARLTVLLGNPYYYGTTSAADLLAWLDQQAGERIMQPIDHGTRATALAMLGQIDEARAALATALAQLADRGASIDLANTYSHTGPELELIIGDPTAAARYAEKGCPMLERMGERGWLSTGLAYLAVAYYQLGRLDQADVTARRAAAIGSSDDATTQMISRRIRAKVAARRGDDVQPERLAQEAVAIADATDQLNERGNAYADLAEVLALAGKPDEAAQALETAAALFARKGNIPAYDRVRARLVSEGVTAPPEPTSL